MGDEWYPATVLRLDCLRALGAPLGDYREVVHRMVKVGEQKMKSSGGPMTLIDDVLDTIAATAVARGHDPAHAGRMARFLLLLWALAVPRTREIQLPPAGVPAGLSPTWWRYAAMVTAGGPPAPGPAGVEERWAAMQSLALPELALKAFHEMDPVVLWRFLSHLLGRPADGNRALTDLTWLGCALLGLVDPEPGAGHA